MKKMFIFILFINIACLYASDSGYEHDLIDQKSFQDQAIPLIKDIEALLPPLAYDESASWDFTSKKHKILLEAFREARIEDVFLHNIISIITNVDCSFSDRAVDLYKNNINLYCLESVRFLLEGIDKKEKEYLFKAENILSSIKSSLRGLDVLDINILGVTDKFSLLRQKLLEENKFDQVAIDAVSLLAYPEFYFNLKLLALSLYNSNISLKYLDYIMEKLESLKPSGSQTLYISPFEDQLCLDRELKRLLYLCQQTDDCFMINMVTLYIDIKSWKNSKNKKIRIIDFMKSENLFNEGLLREEEISKLIEVGIVSDELESLNNGILETIGIRVFFYNLKSFFDSKKIKSNNDIKSILNFLVKDLPWKNKEGKIVMISNCLMQILSDKCNWYEIIKGAVNARITYNDLMALIPKLKLII